MGSIIDFLEKHKNKIPIISAIAGFFLWLVGLITNRKAKKTDDEAKRIVDEAISKYEASEKVTTEVLEKLGELERDVCETYPRLINALEMIDKSHKGLLKGVKKHELSKRNVDELIEISNQVRVAIEGAAGTGGGVLIGMAAFGVNAAALGPGVFLGGVVICARGAKLLKTSDKNLRQAKETQKTVERITKYHSDLREAAESMYQSMSNLYEVYIDYLSKLEEIAADMTKKKRFTKEEELTIKNVTRIVKLLNRMCKVELILKPKKEDEIETVNTKEVNKLIKEGSELIIVV